MCQSSQRISSPDLPLAAVADRLKRLVVISHPTFGDLVLERRNDWFEGEAVWDGISVRVHFTKGRDGTIDNALQTAMTLWTDQSKWKSEVEAYAVKELLKLKNESWLDDDEPPLFEEEFRDFSPIPRDFPHSN